ncbi:hypothetical protein OYC64_017623 [Pagothenia borchgrevinki]|uniref:PH domain-containing protein n=1 Tax=Pagothenia borchgrevinki TaxID=8213 RepID=A0ABD2GM20_PAGBO
MVFPLNITVLSLSQHPCIQKESDYIKFLCCDDQHTLLLWVNSIRIAKYGTTLYKNYQVAMKRAHPSASHKDSYNSQVNTRQAPPQTTNVEDYPHEAPPDFIPPAPPGHTQV